MAGFKIEGSTSGNVAEVDANNNLKVNLPTTQSQAGFAVPLSEIDAGTITASRLLKPFELSENYRLRVGQDQLMFSDQFSVTQQENRNNWASNLSTMTAAVASGFHVLNSGSSLASGANARLTTWKNFQVYKQYTTILEMNVQFSQLPITSNVCEWGWFTCTSTSAPTDGIFFRLDGGGLFKGVICNNSSESTTSAIDFSALVGANATKQFIIDCDSNMARFWINNVLVGSIALPSSLGQLTSSQSNPINFRNYNSALVVGSAQQMKIGAITLSNGDMGSSKPWSHIQAGMGGSAIQIPTGAGGQSSNYTNSLAAGGGFVLTNTTAAAGTGLGGQFSVLPTLAAGTDGLLCSYLVPAASTTIQGKTLYVTGVRIQGAVTTVLVGNATPVVYAYALCVGSTSLGLNTTDSVGAKGARRMPLGYESYAAAAAVGTLGQGVVMNFNSPVPVNSGEYFQISAKNLGVVTTTGVITILVTVDGYWE